MSYLAGGTHYCTLSLIGSRSVGRRRIVLEVPSGAAELSIHIVGRWHRLSNALSFVVAACCLGILLTGTWSAVVDKNCPFVSHSSPPGLLIILLHGVVARPRVACDLVL